MANTDTNSILSQIFNLLGGFLQQNGNNDSVGSVSPSEQRRCRALENPSQPGQLNVAGETVAKLDGTGGPGHLTRGEIDAYRTFADIDGNNAVSGKENRYAQLLLNDQGEIGKLSQERLQNIYNVQSISDGSGNVFDDGAWDANGNPINNITPTASNSTYSSTFSNQPNVSGRMIGFSITN